MFEIKPGAPCSFFHDGGRGDRRWVIGWRYGIIREVPGRGKHLGSVRIEIPVDLWTCVDPVNRKYTRRTRERVWIESPLVNAPGDTIYHGLKTWEVAEQRKERKAAEQDKADKKARRLKT